MTATKTVERWQHLDAALSDPTWTPADIWGHMLRELWQAAKLGAQAEAEVARLQAIVRDRKRWRNVAGPHRRSCCAVPEMEPTP
jgi:hypothetical protein